MGSRLADEMASGQEALQALANEYKTTRSRVDASERRLRAVIAASYGPAAVREAAKELADALRDASAIVVWTLRELRQEAPREGRRRRRRKATRAAPTEIARWSAELMRLSEIRVWLRRTTLDQPGVHVPATVQVSSRAATGPHSAGMMAEPDNVVAFPAGGPRIGVDVGAIVDSYRSLPTVDAAALSRDVPSP